MRAAQGVRKAATATLRQYTNSAETLGAAELIIGELLSNAARHADGHVCLELDCADGNAQVSVHDTSEAFELDIRRPPNEFSEDGRGLFIISELARKISVVPLNGMGKRITVTLDMPIDDAPAFEACQRRWLRHEQGVCMRPRVVKYLPELAEWPGA
ncbi:MAG: ATP-binding protein [Candidatus Eremiobacteraeota bacterium]|nr:ATP-binding protein [Candidatus Eremiobacteraeota bacterium]